jgi:hypothetical protein
MTLPGVNHVIRPSICMARLSLILVCLSFSSEGVAQEIEDQDLRQYAAFLINVSGYLCGEVVSLRFTDREGVFSVTCRGKPRVEGTNYYILDGNTNKVTKI